MLFENLGKSAQKAYKSIATAPTLDQVETKYRKAKKNLTTDFEALKAYNSEMFALTCSNENLSQEQMMNRASSTLQGASDDAKAYAAGKTNVDVNTYKDSMTQSILRFCRTVC